MENDNNQLIKKTAHIAPDSNMNHIYRVSLNNVMRAKYIMSS